MKLTRLAAEGVGTAFLLAAVVGSGIMGERLAGGNAGVALLANSLATAGALFALISALAPISGAHFNPAVTLSLALRGRMSWGEVPSYLVAQCAGAMVGVVAAHTMFALPLWQWSHKARVGGAQSFSEFVATAGLVGVLALLERRGGVGPVKTGAIVAAYVLAAYWFTASTSFANPAVTLARALTDTFSGIRPDGVIAFIAAQLLATVAVGGGARLLARTASELQAATR